MTPFDMVRDHLTASVPFARYVDVTIGDISADGATATLDQRDEVSNHIGSVHAGAMFTLGETASGAALAGALVDRLMAIRPVAASAQIKYVAVAKGILRATATLAVPVEEAKAALDQDGKVQFDVNVDMQDQDGKTVATMVVNWHVKATS